MTEDDKERRVVRARPPRNADPTIPPPDRAPEIASSPEPERPKLMATGSGKFGRTVPEGVLHALGKLKRDEVAAVTFGEYTLTVEHRYGLVVLVLPDGTRATATPEQAEELAKVLLASTVPRR